MGHQIIKQPDGKWCVWSSIVDQFIVIDVTKQELIDWYGNRAKLAAELRTQEIFEQLEKGENPYFQFAITFNELAKTHLKKVKGLEPDPFTKHLRKLQRMKTSGN